MRRLAPVVVAAIISLLLGPGIGPALQPARAAAISGTANDEVQDDFFAFDSVFDYIGQGEQVAFTDVTGSIGIYPVAPWSADIVDIYATLGEQWWHVVLAAPVGQALTVGSYPGAADRDGDTPAIRVHGNHRGCNTNSGAFAIHELSRDGTGLITSIAASFEHWCDGSPTPLTGRVRVNSTLPIAALSTPRESAHFGFVTVGESVPPRTYTVESTGDVPVTVSHVALSGSQAGDFPSIDGCTGDMLDPGESCSYQVGFAPSAIEDRFATASIHSSAPLPPRALPLRGFGRIPTTTTVSIVPDNTYYIPGLRLVATVAPGPGHNQVECWLDGELLAEPVVDHQSIATCHVPRELGTHTFRARYQGSSTYGDSWSAPLSFTASATTAIALTAPVSPKAGASVAVSATVSTPSNLLYPGGTLTIRDATTNTVLGTAPIDRGAATLALTRSFSLGTHQLVATYTGVAGILNASTATQTITAVDGVAPLVSAPTQGIVPNIALGAGGPTFRVRWSGSDATSGIARYELRVQTSGGPWTTISNSLTGTSLDRVLAAGNTYRFAVRAIDMAGNASGWAYGSTFRVTGYQQTSGSITYGGPWSNSGSIAFWGGTARFATAQGAKASFTFTGRSVAWVSLKSYNRGKANVYVNGVYSGSVDLYAASTQGQRIVWTKSWSTSATRTIDIRVVGMVGRPRVDVDGFFIGS